MNDIGALTNKYWGNLKNRMKNIDRGKVKKVGRNIGVYAVLIPTVLLTLKYATGCKDIDIKEEIKENNPVAETVEEIAYETNVEEKEETIENVIETPKASYFDNIDNVLKFEAEPNMFPSNWHIDEINPKAKSLNPAKIPRSKEVMINALKKYPEEVLFENLKKVYVLDYLNFCNGDEPAGTNHSSGLVYLVNKGIENGSTDEGLEDLFHKEFSSIIFRRHNNLFDETAWRKINPEDFEYFYRGGRPPYTFDFELYKTGFLYMYAQSDLENDFNSFAGTLFTDFDYAWEAIGQYPKLKEKLDLTRNFYLDINSNFEPFFREQYKKYDLKW